MEYKGQLFGKVGKTYFPLIKTAEDVDLLESENKSLKECLDSIVNGSAWYAIPQSKKEEAKKLLTPKL